MIEADRTIVPPDLLHHLGITPADPLAMGFPRRSAEGRTLRVNVGVSLRAATDFARLGPQTIGFLASVRAGLPRWAPALAR
jgi:hypothetical protein